MSRILYPLFFNTYNRIITFMNYGHLTVYTYIRGESEAHLRKKEGKSGYLRNKGLISF